MTDKPKKDIKIDEDHVEQYFQECLKIAYNTEPINKDEVRERLIEVYGLESKPVPDRVVFVDSPFAAVAFHACEEAGIPTGGPIKKLKAALKKVKNKEKLQKRMNQSLQDKDYDIWLRYWLLHYTYAYMYLDPDIFTPEDTAELKIWTDFACCANGAILYDDIAIVINRPSEIHVNARGQLHHESRAALLYRDGYCLHMWNGVDLTDRPYIITNPEKITVKEIDAEQNQETKRILLERFGLDRYIQTGDTKLIHEDRFGKLFQKKIEGTDEVLTMLGVDNSTPEPDGSIKKYFLEVETDLRPMLPDGSLGQPQRMTARNAAASLVGLRGEEYDPAIET